MTATEPIYSCSSAEYGITAIVTMRDDGKYAVAIHDDDADEFVPTVWILETIDAAKAKAHTFV